MLSYILKLKWRDFRVSTNDWFQYLFICRIFSRKFINCLIYKMSQTFDVFGWTLLKPSIHYQNIRGLLFFFGCPNQLIVAAVMNNWIDFCVKATFYSKLYLLSALPRLGDGERAVKNRPFEVKLPHELNVTESDTDVDHVRIVGVACGSRHSFIWTEAGLAYGFGNNFYAQLGYDFQRADFKEHQVWGY